MSATLLAANKLQADVAGLTSPTPTEHTGAPASSVDIVSSLLHGESGSLGYLWDQLLPAQIAADPLRGSSPLGPHGGAGHPDAAGQRVLGRGIGAATFAPPAPAAGPPAPRPDLSQIGDAARQAAQSLGEQIRGLIGGESGG